LKHWSELKKTFEKNQRSLQKFIDKIDELLGKSKDEESEKKHKKKHDKRDGSGLWKLMSRKSNDYVFNPVLLDC
jgi:hypothetical protein